MHDGRQRLPGRYVGQQRGQGVPVGRVAGRPGDLGAQLPPPSPPTRPSSPYGTERYGPPAWPARSSPRPRPPPAPPPARPSTPGAQVVDRIPVPATEKVVFL
ncbi:hypothetical protein ACWERJ_38555, partial [Streptomyces sp. NPDC004050]